MTDKYPTDQPLPEADPGADDRTEVWFLRRRDTPPTEHDRLEHLFVCWAWGAQFGSWENAVRALARTLRGLERTGFIERHTLRHPGEPPRHYVTLTEDGRDLLAALSGTPAGGDR